MSVQAWIAVGGGMAAPGVRQRSPERVAGLAPVHVLARALSAKDWATRMHSSRVSDYSGRIARRLGLDARRRAAVALGGDLHDLGKIGVPRELLLKPGPLTPEEHQRVMRHTLIGERLLRPLLPGQEEVLGIVRWHHERVDGLGMPDGLVGEGIPLAARIVAVADAFDAMTSTRPYRAPLSAAMAVAELEASAGTQLDGRCVEAFLVELAAARRRQPGRLSAARSSRGFGRI